MKTVLVTLAVKEEYTEIIHNSCKIEYLITGIGKTNTAYYLTKKLIETNPDFVLNVGTAGTLSHNVGDIFVATNFIDRDYATIKLPGIIYEIDGNLLIEKQINLKNWLQTYNKKGTCSTGDTFVMEASDFTADFVDMEAYSQAFICKQLGIPFLSVKYITDKIGENSIKHWEDKLDDARKTLTTWFSDNNLLPIITKDI